jgi:putative ABC transport system permease protein
MKSAYWWRIAIRELRNSGRFTVAASLSIAAGLLGFVTIAIFAGSFSRQISSTSRVTTGGDFIATSFQKIEDSDLTQIIRALGISTPPTRRISFFTMISSGEESRLVLINALDEFYPTVGDFKTSDGSTPAALQNDAFVMLDPELAQQLQATPGDSIQIGQRKFKMAALVTEDSAGAATGFNIAPKAYIGLNQVASTGLIQFGSRIRYDIIMHKPDALVPDSDQLRNIKTALQNKTIRIRHHSQQSEQIGRLIKYVTDFLKLMSLVGLLMSGVGCWYLIKSFIDQRSQEVAILRCLGSAPADVRKIFSTQLMILSLIAVSLSIVLSLGLAQILPGVFGNLLPKGFSIIVDPMVLLVAALIAVLNIGLFAAPALSRLNDMRPIILLRGAATNSDPGKFSWTWIAIQLMSYWILSIYISKSVRNGSAFFAALLICILVSYGIAQGLIRLLNSASKIKRLELRLPALQIARSPGASLTGFICLGVSAFFLNLPFQIGKSVASQVAPPDNQSERPDLFLFDIQDEQLKSLDEMIQQQGSVLRLPSPMIRARLVRINGREAEQSNEDDSFRTREEENEESARNRTYNLSSRRELASSESIIEGREFNERSPDAGFDQVEFSLEKNFSDRLGVKLGDILSFDLQGVEVSGPVVNFRRVKWTSFQPNFFVLIQPGVLDDAPKSYIAGIGLGQDKDRAALQRAIVKLFPNVSIVDISKTSARIVELTTQLQRIISLMSILTALAAITVIAAIALQGLRTRTQSQTILKTLGMSIGRLQFMAIAEYLILSGIAALTGASLALMIGAGLSEWVFASQPQFDWKSAMILTIVIPALTALVSFVTVRRSFFKPARTLLDSN